MSSLVNRPSAIPIHRAFIPQEALFDFLATPRTSAEVAAHFGVRVPVARDRMRAFSRYIIRDGSKWALVGA